ncbi:MAG: C-GCAxxG-C-C family protein [Defluviitaleaceae bacterium]|nr:C-GCAxxG-C-C family protein [Defluviitaleaceae bacterium]
MSKSDLAAEKFNSGLSCSQAVLCAFADDFSIDENLARFISCGFAGGMKRGETCGALSGGIMALGLQAAQTEKSVQAHKELCFGAVAQLMNDFEQKHGSVLCRELIKDKPDRKPFCTELVRNVVELVEKNTCN